jgi:hypothetical protein
MREEKVGLEFIHGLVVFLTDGAAILIIILDFDI